MGVNKGILVRICLNVNGTSWFRTSNKINDYIKFAFTEFVNVLKNPLMNFKYKGYLTISILCFSKYSLQQVM